MKLSPKTIQILRNFSYINPSIVIKQGSQLSTISPPQTILAKAEIPDSFPSTFGIYDLSRFINTLALIPDPELIFSENSVKISGEGRSSVYYFSEVSTIIQPPVKGINFPSADVECIVGQKSLQDVMKALSVLRLDNIVISGEDGKILLKISDSKNISKNTYSVEIGDTSETFNAVFRAENIKIIDGDYKVLLSSKGLAQFVGIEATYFIALESSSSF